MMKKHAYRWLIIMAVISGCIWRAEVEYHGWHGLIWLQYFHFAIPAGYVLFLLWANAVLELSLAKRIFLNITALAYGVFVYFLLLNSLSALFVSGPSAMFRLLEPVWKYYLSTFSVFLIVPLIPFGTWLILRAFGFRIRFKYCLYSILGMIVSVPLACMLLWMFNHKGGDNAIHAVKSGFLIPLWFISMGVPLKYVRK